MDRSCLSLMSIWIVRGLVCMVRSGWKIYLISLEVFRSYVIGFGFGFVINQVEIKLGLVFRKVIVKGMINEIWIFFFFDLQKWFFWIFVRVCIYVQVVVVGFILGLFFILFQQRTNDGEGCYRFFFFIQEWNFIWQSWLLVC